MSFASDCETDSDNELSQEQEEGEVSNIVEIFLCENLMFSTERSEGENDEGLLTTDGLKIKLKLCESLDIRTHELFMRKTLPQDFKNKLMTTFDEICVHLERVDESMVENIQVQVHGFSKDNFEQLTLDKPGLRLRLQLCFFKKENRQRSVHPSNSFALPAQFFTEQPLILWNVEDIQFSQSSAGSTEDGYYFEKFKCIRNMPYLHDIVEREKPFPLFNGEYEDAEICGLATVSILFDPPLPDIPSNAVEIYKKMLESKIHSDVIIAASDGSTFPCNKVFLAAQSPVFAAMLNAGMAESKGNRVEIKDMTAGGIKALLDYIYTYNLKPAKESCEIALELLRAGHKYDIKSLEEKVITIFTDKKSNGFTLNDAFSLYLFARQVDSMKELELKAASILIAKPDEFMECSAYQQEKEKSLGSVANVVEELFCLTARNSKRLKLSIY